MKIEITSCLAVSEGKEIELVIETSEVYKMNTYRYTIPREAYARLGEPTGEISRETMRDLRYEEEKYRATKKALDILAFGRNSSKTLARKLRHRNFTPEICDEVAELMKEKGYIREDEDVILDAEACIEKCWGMRRTLMYLHDKGYNNETLTSARAFLAEVDYVELCAELIRKQYGKLPKDDAGRQKIFSALLRFGYSTTEIRKAALLVDRYDPTEN